MKDLEVPNPVSVAALANLTSVPAGRLIRAGFEGLGRLLTVGDVLPFEDAKALVACFGFVARPRRP